MEGKINEVLGRIRPFLLSEGGDVELVKYEDGICYVRFTGACAECSINSFTLNDGIKEALINEIDEIVDVVLVND